MYIFCDYSKIHVRNLPAAIGGRDIKMFDLFFDKMYNEYVDKTRIQRLTPVGLAFIGDAVHTLYVRKYLVTESDSVVGTLHTEASKLINAKSQAAVLDALVAADALTPDEADVARRAKNAHLHSRTKAATIDDYHKATALEAVIGYVHLSGDADREERLLAECVRIALNGAHN